MTLISSQISLISELCGSINPSVWPNVENLDLYNQLQLPKNKRRKLTDRMGLYTKEKSAIDLIDNMLTIDPSARIDANNALNCDFFWCPPMPCGLTELLRGLTQSNFANSRKRPLQNDGPFIDVRAKRPKVATTQYFERIY